MDKKQIAIHVFKNAPYKVRDFFYHLVGIDFNNAEIRSNVLITNPNKVIIGDNCFINHGVSILLGGSEYGVTIGNNVYIGPNSLLTTITHKIGGENKRAGENQYLPIAIGDGAWIGAHCTILPGVEIGKGSVIAAGSVVVNDVPPNVMVGGVPAQVIKQL